MPGRDPRVRVERVQPGYDQLANDYHAAFPTPFQTALERCAVEAFADHAIAAGTPGPVVDVGCCTGHVTAVLSERGLQVAGVDPSESMLGIARASHPEIAFGSGDANPRTWGGALGPDRRVAAVLSRFSLIHVPPAQVPGILDSWADIMAPGGVVMIAFQALDGGRAVVSFDHAVAPAWRWHPDVMADHMKHAGFTEAWRTVSRPDAEHRFPECHLLATR